MTCNDRLHYKMCLPRVVVGDNKTCQYFKDKSLFVELPIKATDRLKEELTKYCYERCIDEL